jgi:chitinase
MKKALGATSVLAATLVLAAACTVHQTEGPPSLTGPSEFALSLSITATPDSLSQDGASQSAIRVQARDENGRARSNLSVRIDMYKGGQLVDYGQLAARTLVTGADGSATTAYTAPPAPPSSAGGAGSAVTIAATPMATNYETAIPQNSANTVMIRLVPPGVITAPAETPTPKFVYSPAPPAAYSSVWFDASSSCAGSTACTTPAGITSFAWSFGDGSTGTGQTASHSYTVAGSFVVTLTVTNDRGLSASTTQAVAVVAATLSAPPTAKFTVSPTAPVWGLAVVFDASSSTSALGETIVDFAWNFGDTPEIVHCPRDGPPECDITGRITKHTFTGTGTREFTVNLVVTDSAGRTAWTSAKVPVVP